jgi:hypothetical protein
VVQLTKSHWKHVNHLWLEYISSNQLINGPNINKLPHSLVGIEVLIALVMKNLQYIPGYNAVW